MPTGNKGTALMSALIVVIFGLAYYYRDAIFARKKE